jgi:cation diffusion facilitator family transporter
MSAEHIKNPEKCESCARKVGIISLLANLLLAAFKLFVGFLGRSRALVGSGLCNLSDISSAIVVLIGVKYSKKQPNRRFPYGYGKAEYIGQVVMSLLMIVGTLALVLSSFIVIAKRIIIIPHLVVFFTAVMSAIINGLIYKFTHCGARELNSPILKAHAEHNKIDVISSLLVAVGVIVARRGMHWVDPLVAILESAHIIYGSSIILRDGLKGVMDTSLPDEYADEMKQHILEVKGVRRVNQVRARQAGRYVLLDVVMQLDPDLNVLEAKRINQSVKAHLRSADNYIRNILIQVVPAGS